MREYNAARSPETTFEYNLRRALRYHGVARDEYELLVRDGCAICGSHTPGATSTSRLAFDHNHKTGKFRGLLCGDCNRGLGSFQDSPSRLRAAANYLETGH